MKRIRNEGFCSSLIEEEMKRIRNEGFCSSCKICNRQYYSPSSLREHMRKRHRIPVYRFSKLPDSLKNFALKQVVVLDAEEALRRVSENNAALVKTEAPSILVTDEQECSHADRVQPQCGINGRECNDSGEPAISCISAEKV
ncbi:zinc finger, C2H2 type, partial [Ostertagia ostertagi]